MTRRRANQILTVRAVKINIPPPRVRIFPIESVEPENPREHAIPLATWLRDPTGRLSAFEFTPKRRTITNFLSDNKPSRGRLETPFLKSQPNPRGGNRPALFLLPVFKKQKHLRGHIHPQQGVPLMLRREVFS